MSFRVQLARIRQAFMILVFLTSLFGMNPHPVLADSPAGTLEDFETGFAGSNVGAHADWYDGGAGPVAATGTGVAGSVGLAQDDDIFTWTAHPFQWSDPTLTGVLIGMDFQANGSGGFDDDRVGWMISDSSLNSNDIFGVQLDPGGSGQNIEAYWDGDTFGDDDGRTSIANLTGITANAWYRLRMEVTKLTTTSASIDVTLTALDGSGTPGAVVASGSIPDTDLLEVLSTTDARPNPGYFPDGANIWPAFKNHDGTAGSVDNAYFEILTSTPTCYALTLGHSGNGSTPVASPSTAGCPANEYAAGESISLSGASPDSGWLIDGWYGTDNDSGTADSNTITMPANAHAAGVNYVESAPTCYALTLDHSGNGSTPVASASTTGCPANEYAAGESISLSGASADSGWQIDGWYGTDDDLSTADSNAITMPASVHAAGVDYVESAPTSMVCEDFESGWSDNTAIDNADWYSNNGLLVQDDFGVGGTWGLSNSGNIFTWMGQPFNWDAAETAGYIVQMDFQADGSGEFDDDRVGWMIDPNSTNSDLIFGVQLDNASGHLRMEGYWDHVINVNEDIRVEMADLDSVSLVNNAWYRLSAEITKLTATSAQIDGELWSLDSSGNPVSLVASGSIADTSLLAEADRPDVTYFAGTLWPAYKNHTGAAANADNTCYEVLTGEPPVQYTLTATGDGNGSVTLNPVGGTYDENTVVTLTPVANSGYVFDSWSGDLTGASNPETILMDADKTVTANFIEDTSPPQNLPIVEGDEWRYFKGTAEPGSGWDDIGFDDSSWLIGPSGFGYGDSDDATVLSDMQNSYVSAYIRKEFTVGDPGAVTGLQLSMDYDDSFVAYLNGTEIARNNVTGTPPAYDTIADGNHEASAGTSGLPVEYFTVDPALLVAGTNVLAIQGHNYQATSSDFSLIPGLMATTPLPQYSLTVGNDGNGSVTLDPADGTYDENTVVTLTPVANSGYGFDSWSGPNAGDPVNNGNGTWSITMTGDKEVTANFVELAPLPAGICEDFEDGFTLGQVIGTHAEWFDSGTGPVVTSGEGLAGSIGLAPGSSLFTWTQHPFDWNDSAFASIKFNMDFRSNENGYFDDDRIGWMITDADAASANFFGVQLDTVVGGDGGIVTYWRDSSDTRIQTPIVPLGALSADTWYRLEATITKLTDTSASIDVSLVELDASGDPTGTPYSGTVNDTSTWPDGVPDLSYFTAATMWPAYKNYNAIPGAADNACFDLVSGRFAFIVSTDWHTSDSYPPNSDITAKVAQIADWVDTPPTGMPAPEFMVITGDFPHLWQTQEIITNELGSSFLWYPVIGNHEISDNQGTAYENFFAVRDTVVPALPNIVNYGPTGSINTTYSFDYENAHFVVINPFWDGASDDHTSGGDIPPALNSWVDADLTANDATHEFVFIHTPVYPDWRHTGEDLDANPANRDAFVATLNAHNVETLFAGHTHYYEHDVAPEYPLGTLDQVTNGSLRSGGVPVTVTYVVVEGSTTTYNVYSWTGSAFAPHDQWTIGGSEPPLDCYALTLTYTGTGIAPTASPENSTGCASGEYLADELINLSGAVPGSGWQIESWTGTDNNASSASSNTVTMPASAHTAGVNYILSGPSTLTCESFNTYATTGSTIGTYSGWFDGGAGPIVTAGNGVAGTVGLGDSGSIFTWTAHPFDWNAVDFAGINLQADFQTDSSGHFDDDRVGWMITDSTTGSDNIFGVQLDPGGSGYNIEAYWDGDTFGDNGGRTSIADLPALPANAWYRLRAEITKLTATSAQINATLTALDTSGTPGAIVASGTIADTALVPGTTENETPNPAYFTGPIWPAFKNHSAIVGAFDNACYEIVTGEPPEQYALTVNIVGNGSVSTNPAGGTYYDGTTVQLTANPDPGYAFGGWTGDLTSITNPESLFIDSDKTVTVTFVESNEATVTFQNGLSGYTGTVDTHIMEAEPTTDHGALESVEWDNDDPIGTGQYKYALIRFDDIFGSDTGQIPLGAPIQSATLRYEVFNVGDPADINEIAIDWSASETWNGFGGDAGVQADEYGASLGSATGDTLSLHSIDVTASISAWSLNPSTNRGWIFRPTDTDGVDFRSSEYTTVSSRPSLEVTYLTTEPGEQYNLTVNTAGNGNVSLNPAGGTYPAGMLVKLTAEPALGNAFSDWSGDLIDTVNPVYIVMNADKTVTATFVELPPVALTVNTVGQGSVSIDPSGGLYPVGTVVNLTAAPNSGWYFGGWSGDLSGTANPASITMDVAKSVTATFTEVPTADYFVDNTVACSDTGAGTLAQPFCTISRGADLAVAGETVFVLNGTYAETVFVANNGTAGNPITFQAAPGVTVTGNTGFGAGFGLGAKSYIVIDGFNIYHTLYKGIYVDASDHITISNNHVSYAGADTGAETHQQGIFVRGTTNSLITGNITDHNSCIGIRLINGSDYNTVSNNVSFANSSHIAYPVVAVSDAAGIELTASSHNTVVNNITYGNEDSGINLYVHSTSGIPSSFNLVVGNLSYGNGDHGIDNNDSPNNTLIGNTVHGNGTVGINFEGDNGSYNAVVYNNISVGNGLTPPDGSFGGNLRVDSQSIAGTVLDYNLFNKESASVQIIWNNNSYPSLADFHIVEGGQEVNGVEGDPLFVSPVASVLRTTGVSYPGSETTGDYHLNPGSPAIDSAYSDATGQPLYDIEDNGRVDDPATPNTGAGVRTFDDRGAYEFQTETDIITHSIPLEVGWNLISFNVHPETTEITTVLSSIAGNYNLVYAWDATGAHSTSGNWVKYAPPPAPPFANTLANLDETMGFWIRMTTADTLEVTGTAPVTTDINLSTNAGGWNLVSYPSVANLALPGALSDNGVGTDFTLVYAYHADDPTDPWKLFNRTGPSFANDLTQLTSGWGYWIKVTADHTWSVPYPP